MAEPIYAWLENYLPEIKSPTVIELGAHIGTDTAWIASRLQHPFHFVAVEADQRNFLRLVDVAERVGAHPILMAVCNTSGPIPFYLSSGSRAEGGPQHTDSSSIKQPTGLLTRYPWMTFETTRVLACTLDQIATAERIGDVDFLWSDIQGAELEMIAGGQETLRRTRYLYTECYQFARLYKDQPSYDEVYGMLPGRWDVVFHTTTDVLFKNLDF